MADDDGLSLLDRLNIVDLGAEESRRNGEAPWSNADRMALANHPAFVAMTQQAFKLGSERTAQEMEESDEYVHVDNIRDEDDVRSEGYGAALEWVADMIKSRQA